MRLVPTIVFLGLLAGCSGSPAPSEPTPASAPAEAAVPENVMENFEMRLWPSTEDAGENLVPLLYIRAERVMGLGGDTKELTFEGAEAVVPATSPDSRELQFTAKYGSFVEGERALLRDGVVARIDDMTIELEEITWSVVPGEGGAASSGVAASDRPLRIVSPTQNLEAQALRLYAATETIELREVTGEITFIGELP